ncbi:putative histone acetyltransferase spt10 [Phaeomoniella chlamydospora]|uniref:Putative histone acetyltransferase spt10 n=1 Tax=Phaeomoniella chlamydospora TaxID=158046 RepID=A0A0G2GI25_PHACM|nr:putative histone acetyltransferase spt10 [Phaeomoniella chlamydospora]
MPAMLDDPDSAVHFRVSGPQPYPTAINPQLPPSIFPKSVTLRDKLTNATLVPFSNHAQVPPSLLLYLSDQLNKEIDKGDTYPMIDPLPVEKFGPYWFGNFAAVMILGEIKTLSDVQEMERRGTDWTKVCLGSFYVKPNYPGRSSHICNGGFLVTDLSRNKGVGKLMGECYLEWAPQLGYSYSVFNLVYETNTASTRIWDSLGFKRIGRVPACGSLKSSDELVDAIIFGRELGGEGDDFVSEERFDKIRYYLKHLKYPNGADRHEKSRLRSAATHYRLIGGEDGQPEKLMLKDKEVISDPQQQYEIAQNIHQQSHGGINKTTAQIAVKFHWVRIKETVSLVIKNCAECKESGKAPIVVPEGPATAVKKSPPLVTETQNGLDGNTAFAPTEDNITSNEAYADIKQDPFSAHDPPNMHDTLEQLQQYDMAIDPQIMQQLTDDMNVRYDPHAQMDYTQTGLQAPHHHDMGHPEYDPTQLAHHSHSQDFHVGDDHLMAQAAAAALQHQQLGLVDGSSLDHDSQLPQHLLTGGYVDNDGNPHFNPQ